jgi:hypothetical protein
MEGLEHPGQVMFVEPEAKPGDDVEHETQDNDNRHHQHVEKSRNDMPGLQQLAERTGSILREYQIHLLFFKHGIKHGVGVELG